jgi:hypothetical protein
MSIHIIIYGLTGVTMLVLGVALGMIVYVYRAVSFLEEKILASKV